MVFDFDQPVDRRDSGSLKWDVEPNELPMWVADMDFPTAPCIRAALQRRLDHGVFGYSIVPDAWGDAYVDWWDQRHHFRMDPEWLIFTTGVVPAISSAVRKFTTPGENVLIQTPVYNIFFNSILNNGRRALECPLRYEDGAYSIDFERLERDLSNPQTTMMILCNPHNPVGRIWTRKELAKIGELAAKHHVIVLSDEIHCDITDPGKEYVPFASVSEECRENSITCIAPTKCFNIAGLQTAAVSVPNPYLRHKMWRALNTDEVAEGNAFAVDAAIAAFTKGGEWLDQLRDYIQANKQTVAAFLEQHLPEITLVRSEATYLMWMDCGRICEDASVLADIIREKTGLVLSAGGQYGRTGTSFLRMNIACPARRLAEGLVRLRTGIYAYLDGIHNEAADPDAD